MSTRRKLLKTAAGILATTPLQIACTPQHEPASRRTAGVSKPPRIKSVIRREETLLRLGGEGDNFHMSWDANDRQLVMVDDGWGWIANPRMSYNNRLFAISGDPQNAQFEELSSYPNAPIWGARTFYHGFGTLALDGRIYQFLSNMFHSVKLIYSSDGGMTWRNQDGSTPVVWEPKENQSRETMVFFNEPQNAFSLLSLLQMGRNYADNQDGYVYVYSPNGILEGTMNELVMFRVPKTQILERLAYEYFAGLRADGSGMWTRDIHARAVVHTFPRGWVNERVAWRHPYAWHPSVTYNGPLGLYMMANWGNGVAADGSWFGKPSYLGLWVATNPWGPWNQIHEEPAWRPANDPLARAYQPQIAPKWISKDGKSFWIVWTDWQQTAEFEPLMLKALGSSSSPQECTQLLLQAKKYRPYYGFNTQRIDLVVA